jgi:hypothetical protein
MSTTRLFLPALSAGLLVMPALAPCDVSGLDLGVRAEDIAPSVTVRAHENRTVEEYRVNNRLYMVKVTPVIGAPYYLVDQDGSGDMAWHRGNSQVEQSVPQWTLMSW